MVASTLLIETLSPSISEQSVKAALDDMLYGSRIRLCNPLEELQLIEEAVIDATLPLSPFKRPYLLSQILISMITDELCKCRRVTAAHSNPVSETSYEAALEALASDVKIGRGELLSWNWLYYHYVRVDFDVSINVFCRIATINRRTLLRYQQHGIRRLAFRLIERERIVRENRRRRLLYTQLPSIMPSVLFGRDDEFQFVDQFADRLPQHIQVGGATGVGKTAFVQSVIRSLINSERIEFLLWLGTPTSIREIRQRLTILIQEQGGRISIREFVRCRRIAVVLDGIEALGNDLDGLESILDDLGCAVVFLTSCVPIPIRNLMGYIVLSELALSEAEQFIRTLLSNWHYRRAELLTAEDVDAIWEQTRGNPRAIEQAVYQLQIQRGHLNHDFITPSA
jgi:hypothetical protein